MTLRQKLLLSIAVTAALLIGFHMGDILVEQHDADQAAASHVMILDTPRKLAIPALQLPGGGLFDTNSLTGKWSLLFFGYTNCPDVCPATLNTLARAKQEYSKQLSQSGTGFPRVVFISVDPQRDNAGQLADYVHYFDRDFIGVTGEDKLLRAITAQTYANFIAEPSQTGSGYTVTHSANLALVNDNAELVAVLSPPFTVSSILEALSQLQIVKR